MDRRKATIIFWAIAAGVVLFDLWSKAGAFSYLGARLIDGFDGNIQLLPAPAGKIFPGLALEASINFGAFNGWFAQMGWVLIGVSGLAPIVTYLVVYRAKESSPLLVTSLSLIAGGAMGNLWDRLLFGAVRDFIKVYVTIDGREHVWPNFNIADSAIVVGVILVIWKEFRPSGGDREEIEEPPPPAKEEEQ